MSQQQSYGKACEISPVYVFQSVFQKQKLVLFFSFLVKKKISGSTDNERHFNLRWTWNKQYTTTKWQEKVTQSKQNLI